MRSKITGTEMPMEVYERLANAIIIRAAKDYQFRFEKAETESA